tara:strand:+ start:3377 stop:4048 length:672 start_codon:yes stop_codon:yes gene_type:complete
MRILTILLACLFALESYAQIRVYDPTTGEEKSLDYLKKVGAVDDLKPLEEENYKINRSKYYSEVAGREFRTKEELFEYMNQVPDRHKPIDQQKISGLGTVVVFGSIATLDEEKAENMNSIKAIPNIRTEFYLKRPNSMAALATLGVKTGAVFEGELKFDSGGDNARQLRVSNYPAVIYIAPDGSQARFNLTAGGVTALRMKIGEVQALMQARGMDTRYKPVEE